MLCGQRNCGWWYRVSEAKKPNKQGLFGLEEAPRANRESHEPALYNRYTTRPIIRRGGGVMEPSNWPDPTATAALVARTIDDIEESNEEERNNLLSDLLCAAWGSILAQNQ